MKFKFDERNGMSNKYCPAGQIECENYAGLEDCKIYRVQRLDIQGFTQCPWPDRQVKAGEMYVHKNKEEKALDIFLGKIYNNVNSKLPKTSIYLMLTESMQEAGL